MTSAPPSPLPTSSSRRALLVQVLGPVYLLLVFGLPILVVGQLIASVPIPARYVVYLLAPGVLALGLVCTAGVLSRLHVKGIVPGRFRRDIGEKVYGHRRLYGILWCAVYYTKPVYAGFLSVPPLKYLLLRLFGYRGSLDVSIAPDAWIRDLPLLDLAPGTYIANRATLGTNVVLPDGRILVGQISTGDGAMIGHLTMVAAGTTVGAHSVIGAGCAIGMGVTIGVGVRVGDMTGIDHGVVVGEGARVGTASYVGRRVALGPREQVPSGSRAVSFPFDPQTDQGPRTKPCHLPIPTANSLTTLHAGAFQCRSTP
ncbi:MAG TPA: hypothetical protein VFN22_07800 [Gemmatimonadales bacterium]|nr:hypothetical protein [Gemmatimonadales bacterium]